MDKVKKQDLKHLMPGVARMVRERRSEWGDAHVTDCVNRGMRGEPNQFYAFENGHIVGTAFDGRADLDDLVKSSAMLQGAVFMVMRIPDGVTNGKN
ncbi:MAG: hypothetical protein EPO09_04940 [Aquabacterium sp.]|uniref:hypothetical protein n=1 Tax=Aquabacterium sp. TaxID=1872578 RepID=UPI0011F6EDB8|nr:hypothetical protein [Aquabacterium sp.]TAK97057.1 MAG: hypothetical protein EPO09_04940 [Aquabacterium sp.]